jgi:hypothetical protein
MIAQDFNGFGEPVHIHGAPQSADHLVLNEVLFDVLRVVLTVVEQQPTRDERRLEGRGANRAGARGDE